MCMETSYLILTVMWNGMLAVIPVALAYASLWVSRVRGMGPARKAIIAVLAVVWLGFLPNTCYLLTEWRHFLLSLDVHDLYVRSQRDPYLLMQLLAWSVFYFLYSGFGLVTFALAIRPMEHLAAKRGAAVWFWALPFFVAVSVGVYLGLVLRLNTWDLVSRPSVVWRSMMQIGGRPLLAAFIVVFGVFLWLAYEAIDVWIDGLADRWSRLSGRRIHLGPEMGQS